MRSTIETGSSKKMLLWRRREGGREGRVVRTHDESRTTGCVELVGRSDDRVGYKHACNIELSNRKRKNDTYFLTSAILSSDSSPSTSSPFRFSPSMNGLPKK